MKWILIWVVFFLDDPMGVFVPAENVRFESETECLRQANFVENPEALKLLEKKSGNVYQAVPTCIPKSESP